MTRRFAVFGLPAPQGSKRHVGEGRMVESSKRVKPWRRQVVAAYRDHCFGDMLDGPVSVTVDFYLPRPKAHYGTGRMDAYRRKERGGPLSARTKEVMPNV